MANGFKNLRAARFGSGLACLLASTVHAQDPVDVTGTAADDPAPPRAETAVAEAGPGVPYQDDYLYPDDVLTSADFDDPSLALPGRRYLGAELVYYSNDSNIFGGQSEVGARFHWRRETLGYGELAADIVISDLDGDYYFTDPGGADALVTLRQLDAPISDLWLMSNTVGYHRTRSGDFSGGGYRVRLPSSPLMGASGEFTDQARNVQWFTGRTGRIAGVALNQFENDGGTLSGVAYDQPLSPSLSVFGEVVTFSGNDLVREHSSLLSAARFVSDDQQRTYDVSLLLDDSANAGLWADAEHLLDNEILLRYGAYALAADLAWMDKPIINDEIGAYLRADKHTYAYTLSTGFDILQTGIDSADRYSAQLNNFYFNGNFRLGQNLNVGTAGTVLLRRLDAQQGDVQLSWRLNNYAFLRSWFGTSRFEVYFNRFDSDLPASRRDTQGMLVSHQWRMPQSLRLTTELRIEDGKIGPFNSNQVEASALFRQELGQPVSWGLNASLFRGSGADGISQDGIGLNADLRWSFVPNWFASLIVSHNTASFDTGETFPNGTLETDTTGSSVWLTVGFGKSSGQPVRMLGNGDSSGSGRIQGEIFFDENGDFVRQPGERPAAGVVVLLDGRYEARTDSLGRYTFEPVHTGPHLVALEVSELPLPWGLHDEAPQIVNVSVRGSGIANFALVRLD